MVSRLEEMTVIRNLFTKHEHRVLGGITKEQAIQGAAWFWRSRQFGISFTSPYSLSGAQFYSKLGLRQQMHVSCFDMGQGVGVDVDFSAELTDEGAIVGAVGAVLVLPAAVAVGVVSYAEYENDAGRMLSEFWTYVSSIRPASPSPAASATSEGQKQDDSAASQSHAPPRQCPSCRAFAESDARFCKYCGTWL